MDTGSWTRWEVLVQSAPNEAAVSSALTLIASDIRSSGHPIDWNAIGVRIRHKALTGRLGGIVHRADRRIVLVQESLPDIVAEFVIAHEVGHLMLSFSRSSLPNEEDQCDAFAHQVCATRRPSAHRAPIVEGRRLVVGLEVPSLGYASALSEQIATSVAIAPYALRPCVVRLGIRSRHSDIR
jgi:hypothetical protein